MIQLILFGPPGSGKGTQAARLVDQFHLIHISTGDLFRYEIGNDTELGILAKSYMTKGNLVPDSVTIAMLRKKVAAHPDANGFIFDGFPRTIAQAEALDTLLSESDDTIDALIALEVDEDEIVSRILNRSLTSKRADDGDEAIIRKRIHVYRDETTPVFEYYDAKGLSHSIKGTGTVDSIYDKLQGIVVPLLTAQSEN